MKRPQHFLVTGAAGFLGSHLVERLLRDGHRVLGVDDLSTGSVNNLAAADLDRFELVEGGAAAVLGGSLPGPPVDAVFHLAASVGVAKIVEDPTGSAENNLDQTRAVLGFARRTGAAVLYASSSEVYGKCPVLPLREDADLVFGPTTASRWSYGLAKALDEQLVLDAGRGGIRTVVARLFNAIGRGQLGRYGMVVPRFVAAAASGGELVVHGDGKQSRCFCDARDTADALALLLAGAAGDNSSPHHAGVFNVGGDTPIAIGELARLVNERAVAAGLPGGRITHQDYEEAYGSGFEDPRRRVPDLSRILEATGWSPRIVLADTLDTLLADPAMLRSAAPSARTATESAAADARKAAPTASTLSSGGRR